MSITITMPSLGESVSEGEIGKWLVQEGQRVEKDQPLVEVMTDKADSEVPATEGGVVTRIFAKEGELISVGDQLCEVDSDASATVSQDQATNTTPSEKRPGASDATPSTTGSGPIASPAVRKIARENGIDLSTVTGSGDQGRILPGDLDRTESVTKTENRTTAVATPPPPVTYAQGESSAKGPLARPSAFRVPPFNPAPGDEVIPFSRRRRIIADHMVYSKLTSPHVVTFAECDLHATAKLRNVHKGKFKNEGLNLTYLAFICAATCRALREHRDLNARVLDDAYALLKEINLGIAVDTPDGLVVPVIKNADELSIRGIARAIDEVAQKARDGNLKPDDLANKTFTVSNPGRKGNLVGGAIISQPNVGILRIGEIKKRVVVVEQDGEDAMAIHPVMYMALSYDHRIVDGVQANGFLWRITELLELGDFEI